MKVKKITNVLMLALTLSNTIHPVITNAETILSEEDKAKETSTIQEGVKSIKSVITGLYSDLPKIYTWNKMDASGGYTINDEFMDDYSHYGVYIANPESVEVNYPPDHEELDTYMTWEGFTEENFKPIQVRYKNVSTFKGEPIDVLFNINSVVQGNNTINPKIEIRRDYPKMTMAGLDHIDWSFDFVEAGTTKPVDITFQLRISDIDFKQIVSFDLSKEASDPSRFEASSNTLIKTYENEGMLNFGNESGTVDSDPNGTLIYNGKSSEFSGGFGG